MVFLKAPVSMHGMHANPVTGSPVAMIGASLALASAATSSLLAGIALVPVTAVAFASPASLLCFLDTPIFNKSIGADFFDTQFPSDRCGVDLVPESAGFL